MPNDFDKISLKKFKIKDIVPNATILLLGRRRSGKCLGKGTEILMYDGSIKKVEDVKVGDLVMGDDSTSRTVLGTNSGIDTLYKVTNQKGESYTVNSEHILSLKYTGKNKLKGQSVSKDGVVDIPIKKYLSLPEEYKNNLYGYQVSIDFKNTYIETDPYMLGFCLDSGNNNQINHIPKNYKCNSRENRLKLLAGLIDSELGSYNHKFGYFELIQPFKSDQLTDDTIFLARSLGLICYKENSNIIISGKGIENIPTKMNRCGDISHRGFSYTEDESLFVLSSIKVEELPDNEYYGFELDGNHRFVMGNFIVTHNSWLVRDIFYHHRDIPAGLIFSGTEQANPFFGEFIPDSFIHSEYNPDLMDSVLSKQGTKVRETRTLAKKTLEGAKTKLSNLPRDALVKISKDGLTPSNRFFVVLDDMLADASSWKKEKTIQEIFFNGRHFNLFFILTMQYPLGIPPALRSNIDYVFIFNEPSIKNRKNIYEGYAGAIPTFDHFCNILDSCTQNHECLVIKTSGNSTDLKDQVFWYKASEHEDFRVGHEKLWKYHSLNYNSKYNEERDIDQEKIDELTKKYKNTRKLKVIISREGDVVGYKQEDSE